MSSPTPSAQALRPLRCNPTLQSLEDEDGDQSDWSLVPKPRLYRNQARHQPVSGLGLPLLSRGFPLILHPISLALNLLVSLPKPQAWKVSPAQDPLNSPHPWSASWEGLGDSRSPWKGFPDQDLSSPSSVLDNYSSAPAQSRDPLPSSPRAEQREPLAGKASSPPRSRLRRPGVRAGGGTPSLLLAPGASLFEERTPRE